MHGPTYGAVAGHGIHGQVVDPERLKEEEASQRRVRQLLGEGGTNTHGRNSLALSLTYSLLSVVLLPIAGIDTDATDAGVVQCHPRYGLGKLDYIRGP